MAFLIGTDRSIGMSSNSKSSLLLSPPPPQSPRQLVRTAYTPFRQFVFYDTLMDDWSDMPMLVRRNHCCFQKKSAQLAFPNHRNSWGLLRILPKLGSVSVPASMSEDPTHKVRRRP